MGVQHKIPLIALHKKNQEVSPMTLGLPNIQKVIAYESIDDLETQLAHAIAERKG